MLRARCRSSFCYNGDDCRYRGCYFKFKDIVKYSTWLMFLVWSHKISNVFISLVLIIRFATNISPRKIQPNVQYSLSYKTQLNKNS